MIEDAPKADTYIYIYTRIHLPFEEIMTLEFKKVENHKKHIEIVLWPLSLVKHILSLLSPCHGKVRFSTESMSKSIARFRLL